MTGFRACFKSGDFGFKQGSFCEKTGAYTLQVRPGLDSPLERRASRTSCPRRVCEDFRAKTTQLKAKSTLLKQALRYRLFAACGIFLFAMTSYGAQHWCFQANGSAPCKGVEGRCTRNQDGSYGGFVADTAFIETRGIFGVFGKKNVPYLARYAQICESAKVFGDARISDNAVVYGSAQVDGEAQISDDAQVYGGAHIFGNAQVKGQAQVYGNAQVSGNALIFGQVHVFGDSQIAGEAQIFGGIPSLDSQSSSGLEISLDLPMDTPSNTPESFKPNLDD